MSPRRAPALLALLALLAVAAGCGVDTEEAGTPDQTAPDQGQETTPESVRERNRRRLPRRPAGVVAVTGQRRGSVTPNAAERFRSDSPVDVRFERADEDIAFRQLCEGRVDVVETARPPSRAELRACERNGVDLVVDEDSGRVMPLLVASDAVVLATKNEADAGGDCLTIPTVREIFRAGSPIDNWSQVGFFDIPLATTGPDDETNNFAFFASEVLGIEENATVGDLRSDYKVHDTSAEIRREVTNQTLLARTERRARERLRRLRRQTQEERERVIRRAERRAERPVLQAIERENRRRSRQNRQAPPNLEERNRRRVERAKRRARREAGAAFDRRLLREANRELARELRRVDVPGTVGIFRFTYYELFENRLRPLELWDPERPPGGQEGEDQGEEPRRTTTGQDGDEQRPYCIFPSQRTIADGSYPLSRRLQLWLSRQALRRQEVRSFLLSFMENAQQLATENRLIPIDDATLERQRAIIEGREPPGGGEDGDGTATEPDERPSGQPTVPGVGGAPESDRSSGPATTPQTTQTAEQP